ncbi:glycosyl transferase [Kocuria sp. CH-021]|uniref:glycosyl transferase n=1 Tax=Kocuria sp. CH-021 TaxID=3406735 RepID=UPI003C752B70
MITVLTSSPEPRPTTNPYTVQLLHALRETEGVEVLTFTWRAAMTRRYEVFHAHWPEILVGGRPGPKKLARQILFVLLMLRFRILGTAIVRTVHNLHLPADISPAERVLLRWFDRRTTHRVVINTSTQLPDDQPHSLILHGHYRDWFARWPKQPPIPGRFVFVGRIRRYKGTESLVRAFRALSGPDLSLSISGTPSSDALVVTLRELAEADPRITLRFEFLDDADLAATTTQAEMVVLPYPHMHNSGAALMTLSLDRPVLVPDNEVNRRLSAEVGPGWVHLFEGDLDALDLQRALDTIRSDGGLLRRTPPDLSAREWAETGSAHVAAYRRALDDVDRVRAGSSPRDRSNPGVLR